MISMLSILIVTAGLQRVNDISVPQIESSLYYYNFASSEYFFNRVEDSEGPRTVLDQS